MFIYICACSSYLNKRFRFKTVISRSLPSFNSAHGGTRRGGDMRFSQKHLVHNCVASTDLQMVNLSLRVLARPDERLLPEMYQELGLDYDERVLPSICNEVLAGNSLGHLI